MNIELINYSPFFNKALSELFYDSIHQLCSKDYTKEQLDVWSSSKESTGNKWISRVSEENCFVATVNDEIAGFIAVQQPDYIDLLYVSRNHIGKGLGKLMYNFAENNLLRSKKKVYTYSSKTACPFFSKMGFEIERLNTVEKLGVKLENYLMVKNLS